MLGKTPLAGLEKAGQANSFVPLAYHHKYWLVSARRHWSSTDPDTPRSSHGPSGGRRRRNRGVDFPMANAFHTTKATKGRLIAGKNHILVQ